ncbi:unnamed protein product [Brassica oleracea]|uniref:(rape) hypothetical protein n=1 Tax=Brassica napus TaxID=3708 RepID=A0A816IAE4_BRANA|nr:unnamed protein product [Brassica napus]
MLSWFHVMICGLRHITDFTTPKPSTRPRRYFSRIATIDVGSLSELTTTVGN